jgi:hypothetical protein
MRSSTKKKTSSGTAGSSTAAGRVGTPVELPDGLWERISRKAYELWDQRGRQEGQALQDWLDAEALVMGEIHEARE